MVEVSNVFEVFLHYMRRLKIELDLFFTIRLPYKYFHGVALRERERERERERD
jgi:hypothetical protein